MCLVSSSIPILTGLSHVSVLPKNNIAIEPSSHTSALVKTHWYVPRQEYQSVRHDGLTNHNDKSLLRLAIRHFDSDDKVIGTLLGAPADV